MTVCCIGELEQGVTYLSCVFSDPLPSFLNDRRWGLWVKGYVLSADIYMR